MDRVPFHFVNAVLHCLNSESLAAPRLLTHPLWSSVAEEHHGKRKDYVLWLCNSFPNEYQVFVEQASEYLTPEEWLRSANTHLRVREMHLSSSQWGHSPYRTLEEALQCSLRMAPYLNAVEKMIVSMYLGDENERFSFLWKRPCHTLSYDAGSISFFRDFSVLGWHLANNARLQSVITNLLSYDEVSHLLHLCAKKRLTWRMEFVLLPQSLPRLKTWQADAQWEEICLLATNKSAQPGRATTFYEDEYIRKQFDKSSLTITWK
uniref:F-box domain-containing protein n=1 Tax=Steinernema glaseri TaxID=37863 RepID=A0A1I7ZIF2_9BILA